MNNPVHYQEAAGSNPDHLVYDPRRLEIGEYLKMPDHNFARGQSAQFTVAPEYKGTMRRCESCHDASEDPRRLAALHRPAHGSGGLRNLPHPADVRPGDPSRMTGRW